MGKCQYCDQPAVRYVKRPDRVQRGERNPNAKLTAEQVRDIVNEPKRYGVVQRLATKHNVSTVTISRIRRGKAWRVLV